MLNRIALGVLGIAMATPALAGELTPDEAKRFVAGKYFAYNCFDGTSGLGRIQSDGSVAGMIRMGGRGPDRHVALPAGTIQVKQTSICAAMKGMPFSPCFNVVQTDAKSFRGSVSGLGFAYCDFTRRNPRLELAANLSAPSPGVRGGASPKPTSLAAAEQK